MVTRVAVGMNPGEWQHNPSPPIGVALFPGLRSARWQLASLTPGYNRPLLRSYKKGNIEPYGRETNNTFALPRWNDELVRPKHKATLEDRGNAIAIYCPSPRSSSMLFAARHRKGR